VHIFSADRTRSFVIKAVAAVGALVVGAAILPGPAHAAVRPTVIEVKPGASVADALRNIAPGGTILLDAGVQKPATVGPLAYTATVTMRPAPGADGLVNLGELNLTGIQNLTITGVSTRGLVTINGGTAVTVTASRPLGVLVKGAASQIAVTNNTITGGWNGVTVQSWMGTARPHDVRIAGNTISGQENDNIQIDIANNITVENNVLAGTLVNDNHNDGVQFMGGANLVVRGNRISGQDQGLMFKPEPSLGADSAVLDARVEDNVISNTRDFGVILAGATRTTLVNNTVYDVPKQSVLLTGDNPGTSITSNIIERLYVETTATRPAVDQGNCIAFGGGTLDSSANPLFVDHVSYLLSPLSPCAGLGWSLIG
jgi:parallel beta-helix repeat protein